jgi:two-component system nitrogen regulation response regulator GlnG
MTRSRAILLEDDPALRDLLVEALIGEGLDIRTLATFAEVRDAVMRGETDVVVADFWGSSQTTLLDGDREDIRELASHAPVILLTGRSWAADVTAHELGTRAVIRKPFDLDGLIQTVEDAIAERQS